MGRGRGRRKGRGGGGGGVPGFVVMMPHLLILA